MSSPHVNSFQTGRRVWCWWKANESAYGGNEGVKASDPVEEDAGSPGYSWENRWSCSPSSVELFMSLPGLSKAIKSDPKVHD